VSTWTAFGNRHVEDAEQQIYDHLLALVQSELPVQLIPRFRALFIDGVGYPDAEIMAALDTIATAKMADQDFRFVLNRCCHILINRWQARPQFQAAIPELVSLFEAGPTSQAITYSRSRTVRRLRGLTTDFTHSEQYVTLRRLAQVFTPVETETPEEEASIGSLIRRYPYLYEHCLLAEGSGSDEKAAIRKLQETAQRQYEIDLFQYITYQVRRSQHMDGTTQGGQRIIAPVANPTLLDDDELQGALQHFVGKSQGNYSYRDLAQRFLLNAKAQRYQRFKDDLYEYLTASVDTAYGQRRFNNQLYAQLQGLHPDSHQEPINDFLMIRTCSQLFGFLVVESTQRPEHFLFVDLIANLGPQLTTGLLLKLVLICRKVRPFLGKRFSILFNHYESCTQDTAMWLVQMMENLNIALTTNLSMGDMSLVKQLVR
jgi:hypothetical protein